jgi:hypothetical protein
VQRLSPDGRRPAHFFGDAFARPVPVKYCSIFNDLKENGGPGGPPFEVVSAAGRQILPGKRAPLSRAAPG